MVVQFRKLMHKSYRELVVQLFSANLNSWDEVVIVIFSVLWIIMCSVIYTDIVLEIIMKN